MRFILPLTCLGLSACAALERSPRSGYYYEQTNYETSQKTSLYEERRVGVENDAREELGLLGRSLTDDERTSVDLRIRLKRAENKLLSKRDKKQYYDIRSQLRSDRERLYFLSLPTYEARERWAQNRGLGQKDEVYSDSVASTIESNDIALGMSQKAVNESWGDPDAVEISGNPVYGIERWKYNRYISGNEGYQKELRIVYFEGGRVVGWERGK
ncbi:MAG: hypothetical protein AB7F86_05565 [Bdellovibrionales bacterium]